jgi:hypothetical protein
MPKVPSVTGVTSVIVRPFSDGTAAELNVALSPAAAPGATPPLQLPPVFHSESPAMLVQVAFVAHGTLGAQVCPWTVETSAAARPATQAAVARRVRVVDTDFVRPFADSGATIQRPRARAPDDAEAGVHGRAISPTLPTLLSPCCGKPSVLSETDHQEGLFAGPCHDCSFDSDLGKASLVVNALPLDVCPMGGAANASGNWLTNE